MIMNYKKQICIDSFLKHDEVNQRQTHPQPLSFQKREVQR